MTQGPVLALAASQPKAEPELWRLGAHDLVEGYRSGRFTPVDALEACLERLDGCEPVLNAMTALDRDGARAAARASGERYARGEALGPLDGVPVSVKDNMNQRGLPTSWGSRLLAGFVATEDEWPVARLRAAGALLFGKTNLPEFAMQGYTDNLVTGVTRNPWNTALTPGGSSGGAVAGVAAGYAPLALGTDGGGSIRRPASHCGLVGLKPSMGLVPRGGGLPEIFLGYEVAGAIGRNVADVAAMTAVLADRPLPIDREAPARILFVPRFGDAPVDPRIAAAMEAVAARFAALGHMVETAPAFTIATPVNALWSSLSQIGLAWMFGEPATWPALGLPAGVAPDAGLCGEAARTALAAGRAAPATALFGILEAVEQLKRDLALIFARHDAILTPATAALPWPAADSHPPQIDGRPAGPRGHAVFTALANAAGLPGLAAPSGLIDGLPTGFQLLGPMGADGAILALAAGYEAAHPAF